VRDTIIKEYAMQFCIIYTNFIDIKSMLTDYGKSSEKMSIIFSAFYEDIHGVTDGHGNGDSSPVTARTQRVSGRISRIDMNTR